MTDSYIYDRASAAERERLAILEALNDPFTIACLENIGVGGGWRCLEVGGGKGSIAAWLARRTGPDGRVVATDMDTRFLHELDEPNLEVRRHDIAADPLEREAFDLVHSRFVLEHLPMRDVALERMVAAVRPGGWLLIEDVDFTLPIAADPAHVFADPPSAAAAIARFHQSAATMMPLVGIDVEYGRRLPGLLAAHGLVEVNAETRSRLIRGGSPHARIHQLIVDQLGSRIVATGVMTAEELEHLGALFTDPAFAVMSPTVVAAWGRRPQA